MDALHHGIALVLRYSRRVELVGLCGRRGSRGMGVMRIRGVSGEGY